MERIMTTKSTNPTRKATPKAAPLAVGTLKGCKAAVVKWYDAQDKADMDTVGLIPVAARIKAAKHGEAWPTAKALGIRNTSDMSRLTTALTASVAYATRNGGTASDAFPTFLVLSRNLSGAEMATIARSTSSLSAVILAGKSARVANEAKRKATRAARVGGSIQDGTKVAKASNGTVGNQAGGTGSIDAATNGDKGDTVSDTLAAAIHSLASRVSDAVDNGTLDAKALRELGRFEQIIAKARKAPKVAAVPVTTGK
jgi:hypothetical protein